MSKLEREDLLCYSDDAYTYGSSSSLSAGGGDHPVVVMRTKYLTTSQERSYQNNMDAAAAGFDSGSHPALTEMTTVQEEPMHHETALPRLYHTTNNNGHDRGSKTNQYRRTTSPNHGKNEENIYHAPSDHSALVVCSILLLVVLFVLLVGWWRPSPGLADASFFDYIVVGGGPSGILVATQLARTFPHLRVLVLESGTESQASVRKATATASASGSTTSSAAFSALSSYNSFMYSSPTAVTVGEPGGMGDDLTLNQFDVPLFWSSVAGAPDRPWMRNDVSQLVPATTLDHHWPIHNLLLARALGGSGIHNAMVYVRALSTDVRRWNMTNNESKNETSNGGIWTVENMLKHYVALESYPDNNRMPRPEFWPTDKENHVEESQPDHSSYDWRGHHGPIWTQPAGATAVDALAPLFVQAAVASGQHVLAARGFNQPNRRIGVGYYEFNIRAGVRDSVAHAMLLPQPPHNLVVQTGITVTRVLIDESGNDITPPEYYNNDSRFGPRAFGIECMVQETGHVQRFLLSDTHSAEVILAAGAILTPQILANSGICENGTVLDLPGVGKNLQDHPVVGIAFNLSPDMGLAESSIYTIGDEMENYLVAVSELQSLGDYLSNLTQATQLRLNERLGALGTSGFSAGGFLRSPWAEDESPDIQLTVFPRPIEPHMLHSQQHEKVIKLRSRTMVVTVALLRPDARYQVYPCIEDSPRSPTCTHRNTTSCKANVDRSSPFAKSLLYKLPAIGLPPNTKSYLSERDVQRLAWGIEQVRSIQRTPPLSEATGDELYPGADVTNHKLLDYISKNNLFNSHWVGTTKMGPSSDPDAVVNERLRVFGMRGLRIVDGGVIPHVPNGNTHSTVCVVASQAADLIVEDRRMAAKK